MGGGSKIKSMLRSLKPDDLNVEGDKVFCVGFGKTGTTSLEAALKDFGYKLGDQAQGELLAQDWFKGRTKKIIKFCKTANAFQDVPFGMPGLFKVLDKNFPNSKFILTTRDDENQWFHSLTTFHAKMFAADGRSTPIADELSKATYRYKGWSLDIMKYYFNYPEVELYQPQAYKQIYINHNNAVKAYFVDRPDDLLVLNVSEEGSYQKLAKFLGVDVEENANFPWLNKT